MALVISQTPKNVGFIPEVPKQNIAQPVWRTWVENPEMLKKLPMATPTVKAEKSYFAVPQISGGLLTGLILVGLIAVILIVARRK